MSVYFIRDETGRIKIGHARDPWQRLQDLQGASATELAIIRVVDGGQKVEKWFHNRFKHLRSHREWFEFSEEMLSLAAPDELPPPTPKHRRVRPPGSMAETIRNADRLGLLDDRMRRDFAPFLDAQRSLS